MRIARKFLEDLKCEKRENEQGPWEAGRGIQDLDDDIRAAVSAGCRVRKFWGMAEDEDGEQYGDGVDEGGGWGGQPVSLAWT